MITGTIGYFGITQGSKRYVLEVRNTTTGASIFYTDNVQSTSTSADVLRNASGTVLLTEGDQVLMRAWTDHTGSTVDIRNQPYTTNFSLALITRIL